MHLQNLEATFAASGVAREMGRVGASLPGSAKTGNGEGDTVHRSPRRRGLVACKEQKTMVWNAGTVSLQEIML